MALNFWGGNLLKRTVSQRSHREAAKHRPWKTSNVFPALPCVAAECWTRLKNPCNGTRHMANIPCQAQRFPSLQQIKHDEFPFPVKAWHAIDPAKRNEIVLIP